MLNGTMPQSALVRDRSVMFLVRGAKPESIRASAAERTLRRAQFKAFEAIAEGRSTVRLDEVVSWLHPNPVVPDEAA